MKITIWWFGRCRPAWKKGVGSGRPEGFLKRRNRLACLPMAAGWRRPFRSAFKGSSPRYTLPDMTVCRYFARGELQFITSSTYRRAQLFSSPRCCGEFVKALQAVRAEFRFYLLGWVLMPDHFHLLILPQPADSASRIVQQLKQRSAASLLRILEESAANLWCARMLARLRLPATVHARSSFRVWQRRFYPFGVYSDKKRLEKMDYMHNNPVKRRLVASPDQWSWSSFRFYYLGDASVLSMDRSPESPWQPGPQT